MTRVRWVTAAPRNLTNGTLQINTLNSAGGTSSIGNSSSVASNLVLNGGTLQYIGAGVSTDRLFTLTANGGAIDSSASSNGALNFNNGGSIVASGNGTTTGVLTLTGSSTGANIFGDIIPNPTSGTTSLAKSGVGNWTVSSANTYTGSTTINSGTLTVGAATTAGVSELIGKNSAVIFANTAGATLNMNNFPTQIGSLAGGGSAGGNVITGTANLTTGADNTSQFLARWSPGREARSALFSMVVKKIIP